MVMSNLSSEASTALIVSALESAMRSARYLSRLARRSVAFAITSTRFWSSSAFLAFHSWSCASIWPKFICRASFGGGQIFGVGLPELRLVILPGTDAVHLVPKPPDQGQHEQHRPDEEVLAQG